MNATCSNEATIPMSTVHLFPIRVEALSFVRLKVFAHEHSVNLFQYQVTLLQATTAWRGKNVGGERRRKDDEEI